MKFNHTEARYGARNYCNTTTSGGTYGGRLPDRRCPIHAQADLAKNIPFGVLFRVKGKGGLEKWASDEWQPPPASRLDRSVAVSQYVAVKASRRDVELAWKLYRRHRRVR